MDRRAPSGRFGRLGRAIVRHPWYPVVFWIVILLVALPFLSRLPSAEQNSAASLPADAPSSIANAEAARLFPNASPASSSLLLLLGPNVTGPTGERLSLDLAKAIRTDPGLRDLGNVTTLYDAYQGYLTGLTYVTLGVVQGSVPGAPAYSTMSGAATLVWGPPSYFVTEWQRLVDAHPTTPPGDFNAAAENATAQAYASDPAAITVLRAFYGGPGAPGFNGTSKCGADPVRVVACADAVVRSTVLPMLGALAPALPSAFALAVGSALDVVDPLAASAISQAAATALLEGTGLPPSFASTVRTEFPDGRAPAGGVSAWAASVAQGPVASYPLPIPASILGAFVDPGNDASLVLVAFTVPSSFTTADGSSPISDDVARIAGLEATVLASDPAGGGYRILQTGDAALNAQENHDLNSDLALVLPLTLLALLGITIAYFRAPLAPLLTFGALGIALGLSIAGVVLIGHTFLRVDPTSITLSTTFVLGVGTDYSIFLVARYREELLRGADPKTAVETSVAWAGQSIATSGATAVLATLALAFSGVALLSQWGIVLSLAILLTLLASLTLVPAALTLIGPKVFWPSTGDRFRRQARAESARIAARRGYFYRAASLSRRRPGVLVAVVLAVSVPLLYVALHVPVGYDFYGQLPKGEPASDGLATLGERFGSGAAFPTTILVTFAQPLVSGNATNVVEFQDLAEITAGLSANPSVASVASPVGPTGAPIGTWIGFAGASPVERSLLTGLLAGFVGTDGRTVDLTVTSTSSGLSASAIDLVAGIRGNLTGYAAVHPEITQLAFGGGAETTADLQAETAIATERMVAAVSVGLVVVLFVVLRSWILPLMAVATIGLSIGWAWAMTYLVLGGIFGRPIFYFVPTVLFLLILGLGIDYNIFLLTRVREERLKGRSASEAAVEGVARTGGIITAAAVILASAFAVLISGRFLLLQAIGFSVAIAILLDAMVVRTYLVPSTLHLLGERVWRLGGRRAEGRPAPEGDGTPPT